MITRDEFDALLVDVEAVLGDHLLPEPTDPPDPPPPPPPPTPDPVGEPDPWIPHLILDPGGPVITTVSDGSWHEAATWDVRIPEAGDVVYVRHHVTFGAVADVRDVVIDDGGVVVFEPEAETLLRVETLHVYPEGALEIGTVEAPITGRAEIVIADTPLDLVRDPGTYTHGLLCFGKVSVHGRSVASTFTRLANEPSAGHAHLVTEDDISDWRPGDRLLLPNSNQIRHHGGTIGATETPTVAEVDGHTITLVEPLAYEHHAARDVDGVIDRQPHVGNLTRTVVIRSENPEGVRGHVMVSRRADADIRYAAFLGLGRTRNLNSPVGIFELDSTRFDDEGNPTHVAVNQMGRYPLHMHHLVGPVDPQPNGYQHTLIGNVVDSLADGNLWRWGIVTHASHYGLVQDNIVYRAAGAGISQEEGNEAHNAYIHNFLVSTSGEPDSGKESRSAAGDGMWIRCPLSIVRDNVAADNTFNGYGLFFQRLKGQPRTVTIPAFQGDDHRFGGMPFKFDDHPMIEFSGNEAYGGLTRKGLEVWNLNIGPDHNDDVSLVKDFSVWHLHVLAATGIFVYNVVRLHVDGYLFRQDIRHIHDTRGLTHHVGNATAFHDTQLAQRVVLRNLDVQGAEIGIRIPNEIHDRGKLPGEFIIEDSYIRAHVGLTYHHPRDVGPRSVTVRNTRIGSLPILQAPIDGPHYEIALISDAVNSRANYIAPESFRVVDYQGVEGDTFEMFFLSQHPDEILRQTDTIPGDIGSPEAGLTNQENWDKYGIATGGRVAPCLETRENIAGYVCPLGE